MRDLVPFLQIKKREKKHPWRSVTFSKDTGFSLWTIYSIRILKESNNICWKIPKSCANEGRNEVVKQKHVSWNLDIISLNLLLPSIVFHNKICFYHDFYDFIIFTAYSQVIFYIKRKSQLDYTCMCSIYEILEDYVLHKVLGYGGCHQAWIKMIS